MSDNYTQFSFEIAATEEQTTWLKNTNMYCQEVFFGNPEGKEISKIVHQILGQPPNQEPVGELEFEFNAETNKTHVYASEVSEITYTAKLLQAYLQEFNSPEAIVFEWADTCSKMRLHEFGGGAVVVSRNAMAIKSTLSMTNDMFSQVSIEDPDCILYDEPYFKDSRL